MTVYVPIPDSAIDQDSPITVSLMTALRNNPLARTEIRNRYPVRLYSNGSTVESSVIPINLKTGNTYLDLREHINVDYPAPSSGDYRMFWMYASSYAATISADIYKIEYDSSLNQLEFSYNYEQTGTANSYTKNTTILCDDTWRTLFAIGVFGGASGRNGYLDVKSNGDNIQFRLTFFDPSTYYTAELAMWISRYSGSA